MVRSFLEYILLYNFEFDQDNQQKGIEVNLEATYITHGPTDNEKCQSSNN